MTQPSPALRDEYLGTAEAAKFAGYSEVTWRKLVRAGRVPKPLRIAGKLLWRRSLLENHMRALEIEQGVISAAMK